MDDPSEDWVTVDGVGMWIDLRYQFQVQIY